VTTPEGKEM
jgi:hypothetical protein